MASDTKISDLTAKTTPLDADGFPIHDAAGSATKKVIWSRIKAVLKTYFDTIYGTSVSGESMGGSGVNRTVANTPISGTVRIYDGSARLHGGGVDYTISGKNVTFSVAPDSPFADSRF